MIIALTIAGLLLVAVAMWFQGLWGGLLTFVNMLLAGLIATNWFEPLAHLIDGDQSSYTYLLDFVAFWLLFVLSMIFLRTATDVLSKVQVEFHPALAIPMRTVFALAGGWLFACLIQFSMHLAPLPPDLVRTSAGESNFPGAPDRMWMGTVRLLSRGSFASLDKNVFDQNNQLVSRYASRRAKLAQQTTLRVRR